MNGSMITTFMIVFRESLEASLIVGIVLTVLARLKQSRYFPLVLASSGAAVLASLAAGAVLAGLTSHARGRWEELLEGTISIAACGVLTYMIFWMDRQSKRVKSEIESRVEAVVGRNELFSLALLPFLAVFREGAETVLFLTAVTANSEGLSLLGGILGLAAGILIVCVIFIGGKRVPLRPLFQASGFFLLLMAAGLLAYGIHELHEFGLIPEIYAPVWNLNPILNEKEGLGSFLKALFGYNGNPSLVEVIAYSSYLAGVVFLLSQWGKPSLKEGSPA
jgi:high-affinity iron transporter